MTVSSNIYCCRQHTFSPYSALSPRIKESFTLHRFCLQHGDQGYNVYGHGVNVFGPRDIVGTVTKTGDMQIFKVRNQDVAHFPKECCPQSAPNVIMACGQRYLLIEWS